MDDLLVVIPRNAIQSVHYQFQVVVQIATKFRRLVNIDWVNEHGAPFNVDYHLHGDGAVEAWAIPCFCDLLLCEARLLRCVGDPCAGDTGTFLRVRFAF